jgi:hypothetical protein
MACVWRKRSFSIAKQSSDDSIVGAGSSSSANDDAMMQRPFVVKNNNKFGQPLPAPPPPHGHQWTHTVYPATQDMLLYGQQQQQQKLPCADSGFDASVCLDKDSSRANQYEVPYSHINGQFLRPTTLHHYRSIPTGQSSIGSGYSIEQRQRLLQQQQQQQQQQMQYPFVVQHGRPQLQQQHYLSDYESQ